MSLSAVRVDSGLGNTWIVSSALHQCSTRFRAVSMLRGSDIRLGNDEVAQWVRDFPERIVGFTGLNPRPGPEAMLAELERCWEMGMRGIKLIPQIQGDYPAGYPIEHWGYNYSEKYT